MEEASKLTELITEEEIKETITNLKNNKAPGVDGFFWRVL